HVLIVTVPSIAGVNPYQTPLPKFAWHVGTGSPVDVALVVLSALVTPADRAIAPLHRSFASVGMGVGDGVGVGLGVGVGVGVGVGDGGCVGVGVGVAVGVGVGVSTGVGVGVGVSVGVGVGSWA